MDPRCTPQWICLAHLANQHPNVGTELRAPFPFRLVGPIASKRLSMPANYRVGLDDVQCITPFRPNPRRQGPKSSVCWRKRQSLAALLHYSQLLSQQQVLECQIAS